MRSVVRVYPGPPVKSVIKLLWGCSSVGRAPALQAGGHRFDPVHLHQISRHLNLIVRGMRVRNEKESFIIFSDDCVLFEIVKKLIYTH